MTLELTESWRAWIRHNVSRGCSKDEIFKILFDEGFTYALIKKELHHEPSVAPELLANPLKPRRAQMQSGTDSGISSSSFDRTNVPVSNGAKVISERVELYRVDDFLNETECRQIIELMRATTLRPSTITNHDEQDRGFRTSSTCDLGKLSDRLVQDIDQRICRFLGINPSYSEAMQGQYYSVGDEFKPHTDYFEHGELPYFAGTKGQRTWTFMIYLNDTERGGETRFVRLNHSFQPRRGMALIWNNLTPDGRPNPDTLHQGMPVEEGFKAIITKWFRARDQ